MVRHKRIVIPPPKAVVELVAEAEEVEAPALGSNRPSGLLDGKLSSSPSSSSSSSSLLPLLLVLAVTLGLDDKSLDVVVSLYDDAASSVAIVTDVVTMLLLGLTPLGCCVL